MIARVVSHELPKHRHRWFGAVELDNGLTLYMSGIAAWLFEGDVVEVVIKNEPKEIHGRKILFSRITSSTSFTGKRRSRYGTSFQGILSYQDTALEGRFTGIE